MFPKYESRFKYIKTQIFKVGAPNKDQLKKQNLVLGELMEDVWIVYLAFSTDLEVISEEFYLYDFNAIISAVGGGLGMFLGVSCFGILSKIFQYLLNLPESQVSLT